MLLGTVVGEGPRPRGLPRELPMELPIELPSEFMLDCPMSRYPAVAVVVRRRLSCGGTPLDGSVTSWKRLRLCWSAGSSGGVRADELIDARVGMALEADRGSCCNGGMMDEPICAVGTMLCGGGMWVSRGGGMWFWAALPYVLSVKWSIMGFPGASCSDPSMSVPSFLRDLVCRFGAPRDPRTSGKSTS